MAATHTKRPNRRALRTRKVIMNAFDKLISSKDINKITVSAIAREADIDRKTFYLHFKAIDDLATCKTEEAIEQILMTLKAEGTGKGFPDRLRIVLAEVNRILTANLAVYANIAQRLSTDQALEHFEQASFHALLNSGLNPETATNQQVHMRLQFFLAGAISLYSTWLKSDRSQPIETVSNAIEESILLLYPKE